MAVRPARERLQPKQDLEIVIDPPSDQAIPVDTARLVRLLTSILSRHLATSWPEEGTARRPTNGEVRW